MTPRTTLAVGAALGGVAVALGAFGAHGLETHVTAERLDTWETAVRYHFYHALALAVLALWREREDPRWFRWSAALFLVGVALFSGSLYVLVLLDVPVLGAITPLGGVSLIAGWLSFAAGVFGGRRLGS